MTGLHIADDDRDDIGNNVTWRTLVGALLAAIMMIGGWAWTSTAARLTELATLDQARAERLAVVETDSRNVREQLQTVQSQLRDVDQKLDELLSRHR